MGRQKEQWLSRCVNGGETAQGLRVHFEDERNVLSLDYGGARDGCVCVRQSHPTVYLKWTKCITAK